MSIHIFAFLLEAAKIRKILWRHGHARPMVPLELKYIHLQRIYLNNHHLVPIWKFRPLRSWIRALPGQIDSSGENA